MPSGFKYKDVFSKGRPKHDGWDSFRIKHPPMPSARWAKIYSPFDALKGFDEKIAAQEEIYVPKPMMSEDEKDLLDRKLGILSGCLGSGKKAGSARATIGYFKAEKYDACAIDALGKIKELSGNIRAIDPTGHTIQLEDTLIRIEDILTIDCDVLDDIN